MWRVYATIFPSRHCESPSLGVKPPYLASTETGKIEEHFGFFLGWACLSDCLSGRSV